METDGGKSDSVETRIRVLEAMVSDAKKWVAIVGAVTLGMFGVGVFGLPNFIKTTAEEKAKSVAEKAAEEKAKSVVNSVAEADAIRELHATIRNLGEAAKKGVDSIVENQKNSEKILGSIASAPDRADETLRKIEEAKATIEGAKPRIEARDLPLDLKGGFEKKRQGEFTFDFDVKHCWYYALNSDDFGHMVKIELTIDGRKVLVDTLLTESKIQSLLGPMAKRLATPPQVTIQVFATNF
jgi:hypothetical protein